jgi:phosphoserine/homoserine phosphotransferase
MVKLVIFDLDGTLINSNGDLKFCMNKMLEDYGLPKITTEETYQFVGYGARRFVELALKGNLDNFEERFLTFNKYLRTFSGDNAYIYEGLDELLLTLKEKGVKKGDSVGVFYPNSFDYAAAALGVMSYGAIAVLLPFSLDEKTVFGCTMKYRIGILKEHGLGLKEIQNTIATIKPLDGAKEFLDKLREITQVIILSDTFYQFATPLMKQLGYPTIMCNTLEVAPNGEITGFKMRCDHSKLSTVKALQSVGFETICAGDSYNDLGMIKASKAGFLFRSPEKIIKDNPDLQAFTSYDDLLSAIEKVL